MNGVQLPVIALVTVSKVNRAGRPLRRRARWLATNTTCQPKHRGDLTAGSRPTRPSSRSTRPPLKRFVTTRVLTSATGGTSAASTPRDQVVGRTSFWAAACAALGVGQRRGPVTRRPGWLAASRASSACAPAADQDLRGIPPGVPVWARRDGRWEVAGRRRTANGRRSR